MAIASDVKEQNAAGAWLWSSHGPWCRQINSQRSFRRWRYHALAFCL